MGPFGPAGRRICAVAAAPTAAEMAAQVRAALRETPTIELRLDWLRNDRERDRMLAWLTRSFGQSATRRTTGHKPGRRPVFIATCRRREGGGRFRGDVEAEMNWLVRAAQAGCLWVDIEVESARGLHSRDSLGKFFAQRRRRGRAHMQPPLARVLLSAHDFQRTPSTIELRRLLRRSDVDAVKIAAQARCISDSVRLLRVARRRRDCVAVPMGEIGLPGRILALREGSALAYAPVGEATAPGQASLRELKHLYRAHQLNRQTDIYGVIGNPIAHSLSPLLHNAGFIARGLNAVYLPFLVRDLSDFLKAAAELGVKGFSVTLPHKASILRHLDDCDALAAEIGAVNTVVVRSDRSLYGCNTDYVGVLQALSGKLRIAGNRVLIFGAGGAARATAFALARAGAAVCICARRERAARELARAVGGEVVPRRALRMQNFDAIINATPIGMFPHDEISPLQPRELHCRVVMDLIYRPERTQLLKIAESKGVAAVSGVEMFLAQGIAQWELWTGRQAPAAAMRRVVLGALRAETRQRRSR